MEANPPPLECHLGAAAASDDGKNSIGWKYLIRTDDAKEDARKTVQKMLLA
jgi:hypothetical protein